MLIPALWHRWFIHTQLDSSVVNFYEFIRAEGFTGLRAVWPQPSAEAWTYIAVFGVLQAVLQLYAPGRIVKGPVTPKGNVPVYKVSMSCLCQSRGLWLTLKL